MINRLWLLKRKDSVGYDEYEGFVIRAASEGDARELAAEQAADEGQLTWRNASQTDCVALSQDGEAVVVLGAFNGG